MLACSGSPEPRATNLSGEVVGKGAAGQHSERLDSCLDGDLQECRVYLPMHQGVTNCVIGMQECERGAWGACKDFAEFEVDLSP